MQPSYVVPPPLISLQKLDTAFHLWNDLTVFDLGDLRAFARIADIGTISGAARMLKMPKSSVSRALVRLEEAVGASLVERSTRHLRLTDAGILLRRHARRILDDVGEAESAVSGLIGEPRGELRISVPFTFAAGPLARMLPGFLEHYPDVHVDLTIDNRVVDLLMEDFDVAIRIGPLPDSQLIARRLASLELWPCASPDYLRERQAIDEPADLAGHSIIGHRERRETWHFRAADGAHHDVVVEARAIVPEPDVLRTMLVAGAGIGLLPDFHAKALIEEGKLVRLLPALCNRSVDVHAMYPSHRSLSAKVRVFIDAMIADLNSLERPPVRMRRRRSPRSS